MAPRIEDYALIGDTYTAALVANNGSIDWLCLPRFDSEACFSSLLGSEENGYWQIAPQAKSQVRRRYLPKTLILESVFTTEGGEVALVDFMVPFGGRCALVRQVRGLRGCVLMDMTLVIRFGYGKEVPWVTRTPNGIRAVAGPNALHFISDVPVEGRNFRTYSSFEVSEDQEYSFIMRWNPSYEKGCDKPAPVSELLAKTKSWWEDWSSQISLGKSEFSDEILNSLIVLKALTYRTTGGIVASPTTSLPEKIGGVRNWDYRYCWLRDSTFTLCAFMAAGFHEEADAWREWLLRAVAGMPSQMSTMYGLAGERRLAELELEWLAGYEHSKPVRVGNAAYTQFQLDIYGEVIDTLYIARKLKLSRESHEWSLQRALVRYLEKVWNTPDEGIWEIRGPRQNFTHSKVMAWVAFDRAIKTIEEFNCEGPVDRWKELRSRIHREICEEAFDRQKNSFVQTYGSKELDASLLIMPLVGFLSPTDERIKGTVRAIEKELLADGFVLRYLAGRNKVDGLPGDEGVFLPCSFWLADNYVLQNRFEEAKDLFLRLLSLRNDVGLLSEEYDPRSKRLVGNFPQAFTHVSLVNSAMNLAHPGGPAEQRRRMSPLV